MTVPAPRPAAAPGDATAEFEQLAAELDGLQPSAEMWEAGLRPGSHGGGPTFLRKAVTVGIVKKRGMREAEEVQERQRHAEAKKQKLNTGDALPDGKIFLRKGCASAGALRAVIATKAAAAAEKVAATTAARSAKEEADARKLRDDKKLGQAVWETFAKQHPDVTSMRAALGKLTIQQLRTLISYIDNDSQPLSSAKKEGILDAAVKLAMEEVGREPAGTSGQPNATAGALNTSVMCE